MLILSMFCVCVHACNCKYVCVHAEAGGQYCHLQNIIYLSHWPGIQQLDSQVSKPQ